MKQKVSDYVADFLVKHGVYQVFTVVGGGAMHLNHSFGHHEKIKCLYNHHEQAAAMAAEGYARVKGKPAVCCVTSGPGATNAITGVVGAYQDSIPMLVISGQVKTSLSLPAAREAGVSLRTIGGQEFDIVPVAREGMVKYAVSVREVTQIRYELEKALSLALSGRLGPVWLDVPIDIQGSFVETDMLIGYEEQNLPIQAVNVATIKEIIQRVYKAKRPVFYAGNGIRISGGAFLVGKLAEKLQIPVVTCWDSIDLIADSNPYYAGRGGNMGTRSGNFAVQNSDLILAIGARLSVYQVGWNLDSWARDAFIIMNDIDKNELKKPHLRVDLPICADAKDFMEALIEEADDEKSEGRESWIQQTRVWRENYPVVRQEQREEKKRANVYVFIDILSHMLPKGSITVVANGSASVVGSQTFFVKEGSRFVMNCAISSMGYGLPAAIGAAVATGRDVVCIEGDGSIMMNLQELQTIVKNRLPLKIIVINNKGYHQIRQTQTNIFHDRLVGVGPDSGDLSFPDFSKLIPAFGLPYYSIHSNNESETCLTTFLSKKGPAFLEVFVSITQNFEPKSATRKLSNGQLISPPLEDMAPFLSRKELKKNMYIPMWSEQ